MYMRSLFSQHNILFSPITNAWRKGVRLETASGGRLNKKDGLTRYGDSHVKDKTS